VTSDVTRGLTASERLQEGDQVCSFTIREDKPQVRFVVAHDLLNRRRDAVVEVRRPRGKGPDCRRLEAAEVPPESRHVPSTSVGKLSLFTGPVLRLDRPALMYVSYRLNNRVYWTRNRMTIPAGETLISDGESYARVRCGNRLSPVAALPVSVSEPASEKLENPDWVPPLLANLMPGEGFGDYPYPTNLPAFPALPTSGPVASGTPPVGFPPILPPGVTPLGSNTTSPPPPVSTPEPGALALLLSSTLLFGIWAFFRK